MVFPKCLPNICPRARNTHLSFLIFTSLKVDNNERNEVGREISNLYAQLRDCGDRGLFAFWTCCFCAKILFLFPLATAKLIGDVFTFFDPCTPSIPFAYSRRRANGIGGNNTSAPLGKTDQIGKMNMRTIETLQIFWGVHLAFPALPIPPDIAC